jgi:DNA-binding MarR family transcriptional regulator
VSNDIDPTPHGLIFSAVTTLTRATERLHASGMVAAESGVHLERSLHPVIFALAERGGARVGEIAADIGLVTSTVSRYVSTLAERGLVLRVIDPADSRATWVELTDAGLKMRESLHTAWMGFYDRATASWSDRELARIAQLLTAFADGMREVASTGEPAPLSTGRPVSRVATAAVGRAKG